ncbi:MAG: 30S ribosomal protein S17 [Anaerolineae bacterium]|nr:30S ribosomal protein S17 [Anaerolineae bacterium]MCX8067603.1 30S ribosomal protein S17 [Anaerolineae bacterium]MDW7991877.1 30S ribosomal protein S17 [Anaerolineae bacterium]
MRERRKRLVGRVVSDKMQKTVVVQVERTKRHPLYGKVIKVRKKFYAHDENNECRVGDLVRIVESRPLSRLKRWVVEEILERSERPEVEIREEVIL